MNFPEIPGKKDFYVDQANLISPEAGTQINNIASKLWLERHIPMIVVTIQSLAAQEATNTTVDSYTRALFDFWGLGSPENNYGILLLISRDDRKARIELGASWAHDYDSKTDAIMNNAILPAFKKNDFSTGIVNGVIGLDAMARGVVKPGLTTQQTPSFWMMYLLILVGASILILTVTSLFRSGRKGWAWITIVIILWLLWYILKNIKPGGGDGRFGGGKSGGGGSSGSW